MGLVISSMSEGSPFILNVFLTAFSVNGRESFDQREYSGSPPDSKCQESGHGRVRFQGMKVVVISGRHFLVITGPKTAVTSNGYGSPVMEIAARRSS